MRTVLAFVAALSVSAVLLPIESVAQQPAAGGPTPAPAAQPSLQAPAKSVRKRAKRGRRMAHARIPDAGYDLCRIVDGWRAFPTRDPYSYFDTRRRCHRGVVTY